jgi:hypothetical protein
MAERKAVTPAQIIDQIITRGASREGFFISSLTNFFFQQMHEQ